MTKVTNQKWGCWWFLFSQQLVIEAHNTSFAERHRRRTEVNMQSYLETNHSSPWIYLKYTHVCFIECTKRKSSIVCSLAAVCTTHCLFFLPPDRGMSGLLLLLASLFLHVLVVLAVCLQQPVPPGEGGGVVPDEVHVVEVMETGAGVVRDQVERVQRDVITAEGKEEKKINSSLSGIHLKKL